MTWYAHHIYVQYSKQTRAIMQGHAALAKNLYWVTDVDEYNWFKSELKHTLPANGLLVVRCVAPPSEHCTEWYGTEAIDWQAIKPKTETFVSLTPLEIQPYLNPANKDERFPPVELLGYLKQLSQTAQAVTGYYACTMWGGLVESEYAWVFTPDEYVYIGVEVELVRRQTHVFEAGRHVEVNEGDVLSFMMSHYGLILPNRYFALHERAFPWHKYKIE
jgi:hypothetical protein